MNNVDTDGALDWSTTIRVPAPPQQIIEKFALQTGDILFNSTNSPELVGKSTVFSGHSELVVFSNHFLRIRVNSSKADPRFVGWWLQVQWQKRVFEHLATSWVNQAAVRKDDLLALRIQLPSTSEQQRIVRLLTRVDRLRRLRRHMLEVGKGYLQAVFLEMFEANSASKSWPVYSIASIAKETPNRALC
jgi:type I restriction enzyme S subunit